MKENEAIEVLKDFGKQVTVKADGAYQSTIGQKACNVAIEALTNIQQHRALEKRLTDMFGGELSLEDVTDELERYLKEPDNPHPINAKILTYKEAADWYAYRAIGTPEDFLKMMTDRGFSKENLAQINCNLMLLKEYTAIGTPEELQDMKNDYAEALSDWRQYRKIGTLEECRVAMEKQNETLTVDEAKTIAAKAICIGCGYLAGCKCNYNGGNCMVSKPMLESVSKSFDDWNRRTNDETD